MKTIMLNGFATHESVATTIGASTAIPSSNIAATLAQRAWDEVKKGGAIHPNIRPKTPDQLQGMISKIKSDPVTNLLFTGMEKVIDKVLNLPVSTTTVLATVIACAYYESHLTPNAVANASFDPLFLNKLKEDPDTAMATVPSAAKGVLQLLPGNFRRLYNRVETDPSYAPLKAAMTQAGIYDAIKKIDRDYTKMVRETGIPLEHMGSHPISQVIPSIAFVTGTVKNINNEWSYTHEKGWIPKIKPVSETRLNSLWAMVPGSQKDPDLGFALLYNVYHISGNGILKSTRFKFFHTEGDNYQKRVNLAASFIADPDLIIQNTQIFGE